MKETYDSLNVICDSVARQIDLLVLIEASGNHIGQL